MSDIMGKKRVHLKMASSKTTAKKTAATATLGVFDNDDNCGVRVGYDDPSDLEATAIGRTWARAIEAFLEHQRDKDLSPRTMMFFNSQTRCLAKRAVARGIRFENFGKADLRADCQARLDAGLKPTTVRHEIVVAKELYAYSAREELIATNPFRDYKVFKASVPAKFVPTPADLQKILRAVQDDYKPTLNPAARFANAKLNRFRAQRMLAIIAVAADTTARVHEILALRVENVRFDRCDIQFTKTKNQKSHLHTVPMSDDLAEILTAWLRVRPKRAHTDHIFVTEQGYGPLAPESVSGQFKRHCRAAGLEQMTFHGLRHFSITMIALENRVVAQRIAGHASPLTTDRYVHETASDLRDAHARAAPLSSILRNARSQKQVADRRRGPKAV